MTYLSFGLGAGIGLLYCLASRVTHRLADGSGDRRFFRIILGGVMIRLLAAVMLVVLVLSLLTINARVFSASFLLVFAGGLTYDVWWLHRRSYRVKDKAGKPSESL